MSIPQTVKGKLASKADLIGYLAEGSKSIADWRIGTEHEKFGFCRDTLQPIPYDGPRSVHAMMEGMQRFGWKPIMEGDNLIGLTGDDLANVSLEPGGQFELSGAPLESIHDTCNEVNAHLEQVREVGDEIGVGFLGMGFQPTWTMDETSRMPKGRYNIMRRYMPLVGSRGLDMMHRTCTVQVNLDFGDEADMVKKLRVSLAVQPVAAALFANSPFGEGKPNGFKSMRSEIWRDTDNQRAGMLPFVFEDGMGFERYVDYALDVPMYFVYRDGVYHDVAGQSFHDFLDGGLAAIPGEKPTMADWADHITTIFPEARLKKFIEMRGADGGPWRRLCALPAFWVGLLYDADAQNAAWDLVQDWTAEERQSLRDQVPVRGLDATLRGRTVQDISRDLLAIAHKGLATRARLNTVGENETAFLNVLHEVVESGETLADEMLRKYHGEWAGDVTRVFEEYAY